MNTTEREDALWELEEPVRTLGITVPRWIDQDIDGATIAAINQGGCASGVYLPAVTYHSAIETMAEDGNAVVDYLEGDGFTFTLAPDEETWGQFCCRVLSTAVELWAAQAAEIILERMES